MPPLFKGLTMRNRTPAEVVWPTDGTIVVAEIPSGSSSVARSVPT